MTDKGNRLWGQRRLARVMTEHLAGYEVSQSENTGDDKEKGRIGVD